MLRRETTEVIDLARTWYQAADGAAAVGHDEFSRFMALWVAFNALYELRFGHFQGDRNQVKAFAAWEPAQAVHAKALSIAVYQDAVALLTERGVYNFQTERRERITDKADFVQVLNAVYQVRCNLFHGRKTFEHPRDQQLVRAAHAVVHRLVSELVADLSVWEHAT